MRYIKPPSMLVKISGFKAVVSVYDADGGAMLILLHTWCMNG